MLNKKLLKYILNVKHTIIDDVKMFDDDSIVFYVHPSKGQQCRCGICGRKSPYYDAGRGYRLWRTTDIGLHRAEICADSYRVKCPEHGVVTAYVPWARHESRHTHDFEHTVTWLAMNCSKQAVSRFMRISWNTVGPMISRVRNELDTHPENRFDKRLIRNAGFDQPEASIMDINYTSGRKLNKDLINRLATCEYISEHRNLFITGATGCGKTYMACAFGMEACKRYYNTRYVRMPDLLMDLDIARTEGSYRKVMAKYSNPVLLILDELMLLKPTETEQKDIFELLHRRRKKSSTIFCSQYVFNEWYDQLGGEASPLADAIIDRIAHDSYQINITSIDAEHDRSMREVYGLDKALCE